MPAEILAFLLTAALAAVFATAVALVVLAAAAAWWSAHSALRRLRADRRLEALRAQHYAEVAARARPRVELDAVEFGDWPVLDEEPPVVFPRRRAA